MQSKSIGLENADRLKKHVEVLIFTATQIETKAVLRLFRPFPQEDELISVHVGPLTAIVGKFGAYGVAHIECAMGSVSRDGSTLSAAEAIKFWNPKAVVLTGIAFGRNKSKQKLGDILISSRLAAYEAARIGETTIRRGPIAEASPILLDRFRHAARQHPRRSWSTHFGLFLSGEKLIDSLEFRENLFRDYPEAIGGDMEGTGIYAAASRSGVEWIVVKGISDWADGKKKKIKNYQSIAVRNAVQLCHDVLSNPYALKELEAVPLNLEQMDEAISQQMLRTYFRSLEQEIHNNLVLEIYEKHHYEKFCVTPWITSSGDPSNHSTAQSIFRLAGSKHAAILGGVGSGKTTALRLLALNLCRRQNLHVIPVYVSLASFKVSQKGAKAKQFEQHVNRELDHLGGKSINTLMTMPGISPLLLLDGWDEMTSDETRDVVKRYLRNSKHRYIIASRPEVWRTLPSCDHFSMCMLSDSTIRLFLRKRLDDRRKVDEFVAWIKEFQPMEELARNPLNLSIMAIVFDEEKGNVHKLKRTKLYERAFEVILREYHRKHWSKKPRRFSTKVIVSILQELAYQNMKLGNRRFFTEDELKEAAKGTPENVPEDLADLLAGRLGIIRKRRIGRFEFFHLWYQEFLAARHILHEDINVTQKLSESYMASCLPYAIGLVESVSEAFQIIDTITICDPYNYCQAIPEKDFQDEERRKLLLRVIHYCESRGMSARVETSRALVEAGSSSLNALYSIVRQSKTNYERRAALEAIATLEQDDNKFDEVLLELLGSEKKDLLWHVIEHIGKRKLDTSLECLNNLAQSTTDPIAAGDATWALAEITGNFNHEPPTELKVALIKHLKLDRKHAQGHALRTIGRLRIKEAIPHLVAHFNKKRNDFRWLACEAMANIGSTQARELLEKALGDKDEKVVGTALCCLKEKVISITEDIIESIRCLKGDEEREFMRQTVGSLAKMTLDRLASSDEQGRLATIYIARHCSTSWSESGKLQGRKDLPLNEAGILQARSNVRILRERCISKIISSPAQRAKQTAKIYAEHLRVQMSCSPRLVELDHGDWEGQLVSDLEADNSSGFAKWMINPGKFNVPNASESATDAQRRILEEIVDTALNNRNENVLIVAHKHLIALLMCGLLGESLDEFSYLIDEETKARLLSGRAVADACRRIGKLGDKSC